MWRILLVCVAMLATGIPVHAQSVIRLARIADIPDQFVGGELLRAVYARLNISLEFADVPGKRALALSSSGELDGEVHRIAGLAQTYPTLVQISPAINYIEPSVFTTTLRFDVRGWDSIRDYSIGIVRGVGSSERGTEGFPRVEAVTTMDQLMQMLAAGRIEVAVNDRFSGVLVNRRLGLEELLQPLGPPLQTIPLHHFLHERHRDLVPKVGQVIRGMQASGELDKLRQQVMDSMLSAVKR